VTLQITAQRPIGISAGPPVRLIATHIRLPDGKTVNKDQGPFPTLAASNKGPLLIVTLFLGFADCFGNTSPPPASVDPVRFMVRPREDCKGPPFALKIERDHRQSMVYQLSVDGEKSLSATPGHYEIVCEYPGLEPCVLPVDFSDDVGHAEREARKSDAVRRLKGIQDAVKKWKKRRNKLSRISCSPVKGLSRNLSDLKSSAR